MAQTALDARPIRRDEDIVLETRQLQTHFFTGEGVVRAVDSVDLTLHRGRTLCVVGESGCGKSITARSIMQIVEPPGRIVGGEILYHRRDDDGNQRTIDLASLKPDSRMMRSIRGREIAMIFQEPMTSLSPVHTIGNQICEAIRYHFRVSKDEARQRAEESLRLVSIPRPDQALDRYPFQLSGGMRQRAMIAMALACRPSVLIADEPTTALDVTTQAQILDLMRELQQELDMSLLLITHDLGVVAELADDVAVMYLGTVAEHGSVEHIFDAPKHPYTQALLAAVPRLGEEVSGELRSIRGTVPGPFQRPTGCPYHPRCDAFMPGVCDRIVPATWPVGEGHSARCLLYDPDVSASRSDTTASPQAGAGTNLP